MLKDAKKQKILISVICACAGTCGIGYLSLLVAGNLLTNSCLSFGIFSALALILYYTCQDLSQLNDKKGKIRRIGFSFFVSFFFALSLILGYQLKAAGMTECGLSGKGLILLRSFLLAFSIFPFANLLFKWAEKAETVRSGGQCTQLKGALPAFLISWAFIFLCWIPVFLAYYPAVMAYDFHRQSQEAMKGFIWFNSYQPLAHTWLIWVAFQIGKAVGSLETGMACYSIFQMLVFSAACAYSCNVVYRLLRKKWPVMILAAFYAVFPYNSILSVGVTKDVIFSALFLVFVCLFIDRVFLADTKKQLVLDVLWVLEGALMMLFRNNAFYAVAVFMIFYFLMEKKNQRIRVAVLAVCLLVSGKAAQEGLLLGFGAGRGSQVEMFSVPIQQFARVGYYHGDTLDDETYELINTYIPEEYWEKYNPPLSDTVKNWIGAVVFNETWKGHYGEMLSAWFKVGLKYPNEYIDAFLVLNSGYWFIDDVSYAEVFGSGLDGRMGALSTYSSTVSDSIPDGIEHVSKFPWLENILENIVSANCYYNWPILSNLFKPAFYCWTLLLTAVLCFYNRSRKKLMTVLLPLIYLATMFLGPVVQVRYVLPIIVVVPVMIAVFLKKNS